MLWKERKSEQATRSVLPAHSMKTTSSTSILMSSLLDTPGLLKPHTPNRPIRPWAGSQPHPPHYQTTQARRFNSSAQPENPCRKETDILYLTQGRQLFLQPNPSLARPPRAGEKNATNSQIHSNYEKRREEERQIWNRRAKTVGRLTKLHATQ